jgi:hypothetical protein
MPRRNGHLEVTRAPLYDAEINLRTPPQGKPESIRQIGAIIILTISLIIGPPHLSHIQ